MSLKCVPYYLLLLCFYPVLGQISIKNINSISPDSNILFKDVDNRLKISTNGLKGIRLISNNDNNITSTYDNDFIIIPRSSQPDTLKIFSGKRLLLVRRYLIETVSVPSVRLGSIQSDTASVNEILANRGLRFITNKQLYNFQYRVFYFSTSFLNQNLDTVATTISSDGNLLSKEQQTIIKIQVPNSRVIFHNITVGGPGMKLRQFAPFYIVIR
jgi:hypothetical protein